MMAPATATANSQRYNSPPRSRTSSILYRTSGCPSDARLIGECRRSRGFVSGQFQGNEESVVAEAFKHVHRLARDWDDAQYRSCQDSRRQAARPIAQMTRAKGM